MRWQPPGGIGHESDDLDRRRSGVRGRLNRVPDRVRAPEKFPGKGLVDHRHSRCARNVAFGDYSARIGQSKTVGTMGRWIRDLVMPLALRLFANPGAQAWLYAYHIDWSERVA